MDHTINGGRRAILVIHGSIREKDGFFAEYISRAIVHRCQRRRARIVNEAEAYKSSLGYQLETRDGVETDPNSPGKIDIFEAYWGDLIPQVSDTDTYRNPVFGLALVAYYLHWGFLTSLLSHSFRISFGLVLAAALVGFWFLSVALFGLTFVDNSLGEWANETAIFLAKLLPFGFGSGDGDQASSVMLNGNLAGLEVVTWLTALRLVVTDKLINLMNTVKAYLTNAPGTVNKLTQLVSTSSDAGLLDLIRERVMQPFEELLDRRNEDGELYYDEIILFSHSLGTLVAVDMLAENFHVERLDRVRLMTIASPIGVLKHRSKTLNNQLKLALKYKDVLRWRDYCSGWDFMCSSIRDLPKEHREPVDLTRDGYVIPFVPATHMKYFQDQDILETLLLPYPKVTHKTGQNGLEHPDTQPDEEDT